MLLLATKNNKIPYLAVLTLVPDVFMAKHNSFNVPFK